MPIYFTQLLQVLFHSMHASIHPSIHGFSSHVDPLIPLCFHKISYLRYLLLSSPLLPGYLCFSSILVFICIIGEATKEIIWVIILKTILTTVHCILRLATWCRGTMIKSTPTVFPLFLMQLWTPLTATRWIIQTPHRALAGAPALRYNTKVWLLSLRRPKLVQLPYK